MVIIANKKEARYLSKVAARNKAIEALKLLNMIENNMGDFNDDWSSIEQAKTCLRYALDHLDESIGE